jgi:hypothetical protein
MYENGTIKLKKCATPPKLNKAIKARPPKKLTFFPFSVTFYYTPSYYTQNSLIEVTLTTQHLYDGERI